MSSDKQKRLLAQIEHIKEHQFAFNELMLGPRDVAEYFREYVSSHPDLYERICSAIDVEPKKELVSDA